MNKESILQIVKEESAKLLELIGIESEVEYGFDQGDSDDFIVVKVEIKGDDLGYMIGNHGRHLASLQAVLTGIVRNRVWKEDEGAKFTVVVDVGDYRKQRSEKIERFAMQKADDARLLGEPVDMEPMSPADRRVVHTFLGKFDDIKTESQGEGMDRYVRIIPLSETELGIVSDSEDNVDNEEKEQEE